MEDASNSNPISENRVKQEAPQLAALLREMKEGLDTMRAKVQALTAKVKANNYPIADGISYLEAKHLLLLNYCSFCSSASTICATSFISKRWRLLLSEYWSQYTRQAVTSVFLFIC
ncbi:uncharacterized protein LOC126631470 [Malus sylvestris]|uniref:uncharacterized protein LOC126631470 n=1 Tax=Malus sylvestris TaxID=3752 RepID=UPI0021AC8BD9|nr:uncharacterized protein LOC126631470 [Malus sylvestris]